MATESLSTSNSRLGRSYHETGDEWVRENFKNFDNPSEYHFLEKSARSAATKNFVLDFGHDEALIAFDVGSLSLRTLMQSRSTFPPEVTRWINIWGPNRQPHVIDELSRIYDFSPRLTGLMKSHLARRQSSHSYKQFSNKHIGKAHKYADAWHGRRDEDLEMSSTSQAAYTTVDFDLLRDLSHYDVVNSIWHWSSVDLGPKYFCLGYNSLYNVETRGDAVLDRDRPNGQRIWSWLILCNDKTVISIVEDPVASGIVDADRRDQDALAIRRNMLNVFQQLSRASNLEKQNPISLVPIRYAADDVEDVPDRRPTDAPGLLLYYLFDDWYTSYSLLAKQEHQYGAELSALRNRMMKQADLSHVEKLHHIGRQLAVLKRLYQSYELIIDRILEKQGSAAPEAGLHSIPTSRARFTNPLDPGSFHESVGIFLTTAVRARFERLRDRIRLYALSEIQECIDMKDSLVSMNFSLIAMKESDSVEKLTRITILLAKVTILFLPVSLLTAYFSTAVSTNFTITSYWISFAVILTVSFFILFIFGRVSGTLEGQIVYRTLGQAFREFLKRALGRQK